MILIRDHEYVCEDQGVRMPRTRPGSATAEGSVTWLPGRVLTGGRAAAIETAGAASQIPADCHPEVYDEGFWSRVDAWVGQFGVAGPAGIVLASEVSGTG